jgi:hypothetical protein
MLYIVRKLAMRRIQWHKLYIKWIKYLGEIMGEIITVRNSIGAI